MTQLQTMSATSVNKPNLFILGAAKCGTTSLHYCLNQHPSVFMSAIKEPSFFCEGFQVVKNPIKYFELFDSAGAKTILGEASHAYLTDPSSARVLKGLFPDSRFLVILRNPADRAYSLYHHMRRHGHEWMSTFEKALQAEDERFNSRRFRERCPQYLYNFLYFRSGLYGEQLTRYFSLFKREQFHILTFESLVADPANSLKAIFEFLGVSASFTPKLGDHNKGKITTRVPQLQYFWNRHVAWPQWLRSLGLRMLEKVNMARVQPMHPETRRDLLRRYAADLEVLHDLTGIRFLSADEA